jgi:hypothetical protein
LRTRAKTSLLGGEPGLAGGLPGKIRSLFFVLHGQEPDALTGMGASNGIEELLALDTLVQIAVGAG